MAISFPLNPTTGDTYTAAGKTWTWNGAQWEGVPSSTGIPSGETADRPSNPNIGDQFYNGTLGVLELYTAAGWLPATGANDFNVVLTGSETSVTLDKEYFSGAYTITSALSDTTFDIYLFDTSDNAAGYSNTPSINATGNFNKIVVLGGTNGDLLSFSYKTTFTTSASTTDTFAAPYLTSISVADLPNIDDTTTITGGNFDTDVEVWFDGQNDYSQQAKSVVYGSSTSIVATRPDNLIEDNAPYTIRVVNPGTTSPSGSNKNKLIDSITAGGDPVWVTTAGALPLPLANAAYSTTLEATDPDGGTITYAVTTGQLPAGLSLNSSTGEISGNATTAENQSFTVSATDSGGNITNRSFSIEVVVATGGIEEDVDGYRVHTFTSSGTFTVALDGLDVEYLVIAGGGGGGFDRGGAGGGGGFLTGTLLNRAAGAYSIAVGAGGAGRTGSDQVPGSVGQNSSISYSSSALITANGGGGGGSEGASASSGGSGGGGSYSNNGAAGTSGQGNAGANGIASPRQPGGGGGAGQPGGPSGVNGNGGNGLTSSFLSTSVATSLSVGQVVSSQVYFAGGGGAGDNRDGTSGGAAPGTGGLGGGGNGGVGSGGVGSAGTANTGGGGGGGGMFDSSSNGGSGGSGVVLIRYQI